MSRVLVLLAAGFEEIETCTIVDVLRRAGVEVVLAGLDGPDPVEGSRGMVVLPDSAYRHSDQSFDLVVVPGGSGGAERLAASAEVRNLLRTRVAAEQPVAAICAGPLALDAAGVLPEGGFTCYPGLESRLRAHGRQEEPVVDFSGVVTSQGPGTAMAFALHLVGRLEGDARRAEVARALLYRA